MIYTNNQRSKEWVFRIKNYLEYKLNNNLFDHVISAFKINGRHLELCRTSHDKTFKDFIKCTKLPNNTKVCFIDDQYHSGMKHENVYYIKVKPYVYMLDFNEMITRYLNKINSQTYTKSNLEFSTQIINYIHFVNLPYIRKLEEEQQIDIIISKRIMNHLNKFLNIRINKNKTINKTLKQKDLINKISKTYKYKYKL
jgi:hypothetical protein